VEVCAGNQHLLSGTMCLIFCPPLFRESGKSGKEQVAAVCTSCAPKIGRFNEREEL